MKTPNQKFSNRFSTYMLWGAIGSGALLAYYSSQKKRQGEPSGNSKSPLIAAGAPLNVAGNTSGKGFQDYQKVYNDIAKKIHDQEDADGGIGRYGLLTRLAWHNSGSYEKEHNTGGSFNGTMIYQPESTDPENKGLEVGRDFLFEFLVKYPWISRGDLWTLGGVTAVQECGGPKIPWRPGRKDTNDLNKVPPHGRLPSGQGDPTHVRNVFSRLGFDERETVALIGAHVLGQCHPYYSGYSGPWGPSYNMFSNDFYVRLLGKWHIKQWSGKRQYEDDETNSFMMLPSDMALREDSSFLKYVKMYADDQDLFFEDFSKAFSKLLELGISFPKDQSQWQFQTLDDQDEDE